MGCNTSKEFSYYDCPYEEEIAIRQFELEDLNCYSKLFSSIINQFGVSQGLIDKNKADNIFKKEYSELMIKLLETYKKESNQKEFYDNEKLKNLVYLTCPDCIVKVNEKKTHDKIGYFLYKIKRNINDELVRPIPRQLDSLNDFVGNLFDIAVVDIINAYCNIKNKDVQLLNDLKKAKSIFIKKYILTFFTIGDVVQECYSYEDIEKKFTENPMLFTSGDIRLMAWKCLSTIPTK